MSLAWSSLVILLLLLPGVLFFVGLYIPEQFTRETTERSPIGYVAGVMGISFVVHGILFLLSPLVCGRDLLFLGPKIPCIDMNAVVSVVTLEKPTPSDSLAIGTMLNRYGRWIFSYIIGSTAIGIWLGQMVGSLVVRGKLRALTQHGWIYSLNTTRGLTMAYVLTNVRQDQRILLYKGFLVAFGLQRNGSFSYIVLRDTVRGYLVLAEENPRTTAAAGWTKIGNTASAATQAGNTEPRLRETSYFVIEGEDIANVVFDNYAADLTISTKDLDQAIAELLKEFELEDLISNERRGKTTPVAPAKRPRGRKRR